MNGLCSDAIALDSNVFIDLFNPQKNSVEHIDKLLTSLAEDGIFLLIDSSGHIANEYAEKIEPMIHNLDDTGTQSYLLRYWMNVDRRKLQEIDRRSSLWRSIDTIIIERREVVDRCFVSVAFLNGKPLVTNDDLHIISGPPREFRGGRATSRRRRLSRIAAYEGLVGAIHSTVEAHALL